MLMFNKSRRIQSHLYVQDVNSDMKDVQSVNVRFCSKSTMPSKHVKILESHPSENTFLSTILGIGM